jgi:hypothetical protein
MTTPPADISQVSFKDRTKLKQLIYERAMIGYVFSYEKLVNAMNEALNGRNVDIVWLIQSAIVAWDDNAAKELKDKLNEQISAIFSENGIEKTLRHEDPFGNAKDIIYMSSTASSFSKESAAQIALADYGIPAATFQEILARATIKTPYVTVQCRNVKDDGTVDDSLTGANRKGRGKK